MHLFTNYIEPLTVWLYDHSYWALFFTFLLSFIESLAIVGSFIPGTIAMTAIGILAGTGVMRIDLAYLAAMLGAILGDNASYALGYYFSKSLNNIWPFSRYPKWLKYGEEYFENHGSKSIIIGRFFGPTRSIIPLVAGMLNMNKLHFLLANIISAALWSFINITPGILIGTASDELSTESATYLFILIIIILFIFWLLGMLLKWVIIHTNSYLHANLNNFWIKINSTPMVSFFTKKLTPKYEESHFKTAVLFIFFNVISFLAIISIILIVQESWITKIDKHLYLFFQSLRTDEFDVFFTVINLSVSEIPILILFSSTIFIAIYNKYWRKLKYLITLVVLNAIIILVCCNTINLPLINVSPNMAIRPLFPDINLTFASSLFVFLIFYLANNYKTLVMMMLKFLLISLLLLKGIALIYFGDNWFISILASYLFGLSTCIYIFLLFRQQDPFNINTKPPIIFSFIIYILAATLTSFVYFKQTLLIHNNDPIKYEISYKNWWKQDEPILPIYNINRIGNPGRILNIQYLGSLTPLKNSLETFGWKEQKSIFIYSLISYTNDKNYSKRLPFLAELYKNKKPKLIMTKKLKSSNKFLIFRLWESNYFILPNRNPIWIGSLCEIGELKTTNVNKSSINQPLHSYVMESLPGFTFKEINIDSKFLKNLSRNKSMTLLLIKLDK